MKKFICIFGSNSLLAKEFINTFYREFNIIGIFRKDIDKEIKKKLFKSLQYDIGKKNSYAQNKIYSNYIKDLVSDKKIKFLLFSWSGKHRTSKNSDVEKNKHINQNIVENFLCISSLCKPTKIIFLSSAGAIYDQSSDSYAKESDNPKPSSDYGLQKLIAEKYIKEFCESNFIDLIILRVSTAYGYNPEIAENGVINKWLMLAKNNKEICIYNSLESSINFISFAQVSKSLSYCLNSNLKGCFNIGSEESTTLGEILDLVKKISGKKNLEIKYESKNKRKFNLSTDAFKKNTNLYFKSEIDKEAHKIYQLIN